MSDREDLLREGLVDAMRHDPELYLAAADALEVLQNESERSVRVGAVRREASRPPRVLKPLRATAAEED